MGESGSIGERRRGGLSLAVRIFVISAFLIALSVGAVVAFTSFQGGRIADEAVRKALSRSSSLQLTLQEQRYEQLKLMARVFVADPHRVAYIVEAVQGIDRGEEVDVVSLLDLLAERQADFGYDFAIILDAWGRVLVRTDQPQATGQDLAERPLVAACLESYEASGVWREGDRLYHAVGVPVTLGFDLFGFLVTGFAMDELLALEVKRIGDTEVAFLAGGPEGPKAVASTLSPSLLEELISAVATDGSVPGEVRAEEGPEGELRFAPGGRTWVAQLVPLVDASGGSVGLTVTLMSLDEVLAGYRQIQRAALVAGSLFILVALAVSYFLSSQTLQPLNRLAAAADAAAEGRYDEEVPVDRRDEVGVLAGAFNRLLSALREKRDLEAYLADLSRNLPESERGAGAAETVETGCRETTLLGVELRRYARPRGERQVDDIVDGLSRDLVRLASAVRSHRGTVEGRSGHRILACFDGRERSQRALAAASQILAELARAGAGGSPSEPPVVVLTSGEALSGSVTWRHGAEPAVVGLPVQQIESLMREATPGEIVLSAGVHEELAETLERAGLQLAGQRGLLSSQPLFTLDAGKAAELLGLEGTTAVLERPTARQATVAARGPSLSRIGPGMVVANRFEVLAVLGAGGMGVVYKVRDRKLDEVVALKVLHQQVWGDREHVERLKSELKLARRITHPNVLRTYDFGEMDGLPFITMEYVPGMTLRYLLSQSGRPPYSAALRLARQLCAGLAAAHAMGILHRDIKPENLILDPAGNARLMDFGIARPLQRLVPGQTEPGMLVGTPNYLAPEQIEGREVDARADIYACGVLFYELFTGRLPFAGTQAVEVLMAHLKQEHPPPRSYWEAMPARLEEIILRCLAKDPDRRYATVAQLSSDLAALRG